MSLGCGDSSHGWFHGSPASGGGIERVFASAGKQLMMLLRKKKKLKKNYGQDAGKHIEGRNQYQIADLG